jgi:hypothetical protein
LLLLDIHLSILSRFFFKKYSPLMSTYMYIFWCYKYIFNSIVITTNGTYSWSFVTQILLSGQTSHGGDCKTFEMTNVSSEGEIYITSRSLFVLLSFIFKSLCCLSLDLRLPLVSSNLSCCIILNCILKLVLLYFDAYSWRVPVKQNIEIIQ